MTNFQIRDIIQTQKANFGNYSTIHTLKYRFEKIPIPKSERTVQEVIMNAYYSNTNTRRYTQSNSDAIRKAYISKSRKQAVTNFISSLSESIDTQALKSLVLALKIISGIVCAISFFAVVGMIEAGTISAVSVLRPNASCLSLCSLVVQICELNLVSIT